MDAEIPPPGVTAAEAEHVARVLRATLMIFAQGMAGAPSHWARSALALELDDARGRLAGYERFAMELRPMAPPEPEANVLHLEVERPAAIERRRARTKMRARDLS